MIERSAADLVDALAAGEITSVELTHAFLDRIAAIDPQLNAYLLVQRSRRWIRHAP